MNIVEDEIFGAQDKPPCGPVESRILELKEKGIIEYVSQEALEAEAVIMDLNELQKENLLHTTGLNRDKEVTRNYFYASKDSKDCICNMELVELGLMESFESKLVGTGEVAFRCTPWGLRVAEFLSLIGKSSEKAKKRSNK